MTVGVRAQAGPQPPARDRVELILSQLDRLPTLPAVVARLLGLLRAEDGA